MPEKKEVEVTSALVITDISKKGNEYSKLHLDFSNGYKMQVFLTSEQAFILNQK